jgi:D-alanine-D-alanine ligase
MRNERIRLAVVFGGRSGEHEVSLASATSVIEAADKSRYEIVPVGIDKQGRWITSGDPMAQLTGGERTLTGLLGPLSPAAERVELVPGASTAGFPKVDVVFPVLHGTFGEDGTVQGLLELAGLPYVGAGVLGSALGMDKVTQKAVLKEHGLPVLDWLLVIRRHLERDLEAVVRAAEERFAYPMFVKPANMGSSVGISCAHAPAELRSALRQAARFDRRLLIEPGVDAREIECSVLGNDDPIASVPGEIVPCNAFYDYEAKYLDDASELHIPADLPPETAATIREMAVAAFRAIDCAGMARVDFFLDRTTGAICINELNTIPGFTKISMYPKLWEASGLSYQALIDRLVDLALERHGDRMATETTYS